MKIYSRLNHASLIASLIFVAIAFSFLVSCSQKKNWEIVCDGKGHWSYTNGWGDVLHSFDSRHEAELALHDHKRAVDEYIAEKKAADSIRWHSCPAVAAPTGSPSPEK